MAQQQSTQAIKGIEEKRDILLSKLSNVKSLGDGKWIACCPYHDDKTPSLPIRYGFNGGIILNCLAGCATENVLAAIGLTFADLFPDKPQNIQYGQSQKYPKISRFDIFPKVVESALLLHTYITEANQGIKHTNKDLQAVNAAMEVIWACRREVR